MPTDPLGRLRLPRLIKMLSAFHLAPPIVKMLRGPWNVGRFANVQFANVLRRFSLTCSDLVS